MRLNTFENSPFQIQISFWKLIQYIEDEIRENPERPRAIYLRSLLESVRKKSLLIEGMKTVEEVREQQALIEELLEVVFPSALSNNEIKAVSMPFQNLIFNHSKRFKNLLEDAGTEFDISIRDFDQHQYYITSCCIILNYYFKKNFDISRPFFVDIPDAKGFMRHYRVLYNADFAQVHPTEKAVMLTDGDIQELEDNYDNLELWKAKFPQESWILSGFGLISLVDVTIESALSTLKSNLLKSEFGFIDVSTSLSHIFSSIYKLPNLKVGFTSLDLDEISQIEFREFLGFKSYSLNEECTSLVLCKRAYESLFKEYKYYSVSDVDELANGEDVNLMAQNLMRNGIRSCILAPILVHGKVEGVIEIVSETPRALHSVNAQKLSSIMPIITDAFERIQSEINNHIEAIVQREYTTIHPSVYWKFIKEARRNYFENISEKDYLIKEIVFEQVYPLYGEMDVKGSSFLRNRAVIQDLNEQLSMLLQLLKQGDWMNQTLIFEKRILKLTSFQRQLHEYFYTGLEQNLQEYIRNEIHPFLEQNRTAFDSKNMELYFQRIEPEFQTYYYNRKVFDQAVGKLNKQLVDILDSRQVEAQRIFPHYYERFKSDGIEHTMYIGASIEPNQIFDFIYFQNLRLWQLQVFAEMLLLHYKSSSKETNSLELTALILIYDTALSIRFRMDEKRFDIDGSYHTRYEVIKKRLDKACIKDSEERVVQPNKIAVVFANQTDQEEYMKYIAYFQDKGLLSSAIDFIEVEDLQGISGLTGIRFGVNLDFNSNALDYSGLIRDYLKSHYL